MANQYQEIMYERIGKEIANNQGELMKIIGYVNCMNIVVMFKDTGKTVNTTYQHFKLGDVTDEYYPSFKGNKVRGCIGHTKTKDSDHKYKRSYKVWSGILKRCCNENSPHLAELYPSYDGCTVCDEWLCYENFEKWYNENYYEVDDETMHVDKDILVKGNRVYGPDTCIFVPQRINALFRSKRRDKKSSYPIGVSYDHGYFVATARKDGVKTVTYHKTVDDAFYSYKTMKEDIIKQVADEYKDKIPQKLYNAMYAYEVEITD